MAAARAPTSVELGRRAGVEIGEVYRIDASLRGTSLNAYVDGIGSSKRVVLYDTLLAGAEREELRSVVAHELGHVAGDDIRRGILYVAIVAPLGLLFVRELVNAICRRTGVDPGSPAALPAYLLAITLATFLINVPANQLSRKVEATADDFALELTEDPQALVELQQRLGRANLSDPDPPNVFTTLFGTHPPAVSGSARRSPTNASGEPVAQLANDGPESAIDRKESAVISRPRARSCSARHPRSSSARAGSIAILCTSPGRAGFAWGSKGVPSASPSTAPGPRRWSRRRCRCCRCRPDRRSRRREKLRPRHRRTHSRASAAVAEDDRHLSPEHRAAVDRDDAGLTVGILAGSVDVAEPETGRLDAIEAGVERDISLGRQLRLPVLSVRATFRGLVEWQLAPGALAVDRSTGGGEQKPRVRCAPRSFEQVDRPADVERQIVVRIADRAPDVDLRREVEDRLRPMLGKDGVERPLVRDAADDEPRPCGD